MRRRRYSSVALVFLLILIGLGLWWFRRPNSTAPAKTATTPAPVKIDSVKIVSQPTQVELPKAPAVSANAGTADALAEPFDPQADLKTAIPDIARMAQDGDFEGIYKAYTPPDKLNPKEIQLLEKVQHGAVAKQAAIEIAQDPRKQKLMQQILDSAARSWEALETQPPTYSANGDEATYMYSSPDYTGPSGTYPVTFVKINGKWYQKPLPATGNMSFIGPATTSTK